ncbi:MAG: TonB-dependent receptor [Bryobacteraceae bacterium]
MRVNRLSILCLWLVLLSASSWAQTSLASLSGTISDPSGARLPNAKVELTNLDQNVVRSTTTNSVGIYAFEALPPGQYKVRMSAQGFATHEAAQFALVSAQVASVDAALQIGSADTVVSVVAESVELQTEAPVRQSSITAQQTTQLPIANRNAVMMALTVPGVSTNRGASGQDTFSVNGARGRSNNFLLDGTENNDISIAGQAFQVTNPDAVREVAVQTSNYDVEFGRAGGAVVNTIIKSGTNTMHGTAAYLVESTRLNAITNQESGNKDIIKRGHPLPGTDHWISGTLGGAIKKDRTFFFAAYQERRLTANSTTALTTVSAAGKEKIRTLSPPGANPSVDNYFIGIGPNLANSQFSTVDLGLGRGPLEIGTIVRAYPYTMTEHQPIFKIDHKINENNFLMGRFAVEDIKTPYGGSASFEGFDTGSRGRYQNALLSYTRIIRANITNELRLPYNRITAEFPNDASNPAAQTLPLITVAGASAVGVRNTFPQGRVANNYGLQETLSIVHRAHSFRMGVDLLQQRAVQTAPFNGRGALSYNAGGGFNQWANFIDDFGGSGTSSASALKDFGSPKFYPDLFRHAYFFQDRWRMSDSLTLTLGLRYEYFGLPMNSLQTPAFSGLFNVNTSNPAVFTGPFSAPNKVEPDKNNFAPAFGLAWSPSAGKGLLGWILGEKKSVWRMGYQMGYDSFFNNIASNAQASSPNLVGTSVTSVVDTANPRGIAKLSSAIPAAPRALLPLDAQSLVMPGLRNPYYQRWSAGFQRHLTRNTILDISYVGSKGTRLYATEDVNPLVPTNLRILPPGLTAANVPYALPGRYDNLQGTRTIRTNGGSSTYHSLQISGRKQMSKGLSFTGSYVWSKLIDNASDPFAVTLFANTNLAAVPAIFGGQQMERGLSIFDRTQRTTATWVYELPFYSSQKGMVGHLAGGWQASGVLMLESGVPLSIVNGLDADGFGGAGDRPNYNPNGQPGVRAQLSTTSPTGYINPETGGSINPAAAMYVQLAACNVTANPNGCATGNLGRNTFRGPGIANVDVSFLKKTKIMDTESGAVFADLRVDFYNFFNHPQYGNQGASPFQPASPSLGSNVQTTAGGRFLNPAFMDGGARSVRLSLKITF